MVLKGLPSWLWQSLILVVAWAALMTAITLWASGFWHDLDIRYLGGMSASRTITFNSQVQLVDVQIDDSGTIAARNRNRCTMAAFLDNLVQHKQHPAGVILDFEFDPIPPIPCAAQHGASTSLASAIARAKDAGINVFATEEMPVDDRGDVNGPLDPLDPAIYATLLAGHTHVSFPDSGGLFYQTCYTAMGIKGSWSIPDVWSIPDLALNPKVVASSCDPQSVEVFVGAKSLERTPPSVTAISAQRPFPAGVDFGGNYVILGTLEDDRPVTGMQADFQRQCSKPNAPVYCSESGPELLGWALGNRLDQTVGSGKTRTAMTQLDGLLMMYVPTFAALVALAFAAWYLFLRRMPLRAARRFLPWMAAILALGVGFAGFALFQMFASSQSLQSQVSLISIGMTLAAGLCVVRGVEIERELIDAEEERREAPVDYDVFISYAHDDLAWVLEHVYAPLQNARLPDGDKLKLFFDTAEIHTGTAWHDRIYRAIDGSRVVVPVYSARYFERPHCNAELRRAHTKWIERGPDSGCMLPVVHGTPEIPVTVNDVQYVNLDDHPEAMEGIVKQIVAKIGRTAGTTAVLLALAFAWPLHAQAAPPQLHVSQLMRDGNPQSRIDDVTLRDLNGKVLPKGQGVTQGEAIPDETRIDVGEHDVVVVDYDTSGRSSKATLEPGSSDTFWYTGSQEMVAVSGGKATFDDPLSFFHVTAQSVTLSHHTTIFSVDVEPTSLTVTCTEGSVQAELLGSTTSSGNSLSASTVGYGSLVGSANATTSTGSQLINAGGTIQRVDALKAQGGDSSITYRIEKQQTEAETELVHDEKNAAAGDPVAQYDMGARFGFGLGVTHDNAEAFHWYQLAAGSGFAPAQVAIGNMYYYGLGVPRDDASAYQWYKRAADQGDPNGQNDVGLLFYYGSGVPRDYAQALHWYQMAAAQGLQDAENNIGVLYEDGSGVPLDYQQARHWYALAANQGQVVAEYNLGSIYVHGYGVNVDYKAAYEWLSLAAAQNDSYSENEIGYMYEFGLGLPQSYAAALKWYQAAADQGYDVGEYNVGIMYESGHGVTQDYATALHYFQLAAQQDYSDAETEIGFMYHKGEGVTADPKMAMHWYQLAAADDNPIAQYDIGTLYDDGLGVPQDYAQALHWFGLAAAQGYARGEYGLGYLYENGYGVPVDYAKAMDEYRKSADQNYALAQAVLGNMYYYGEGVKQDYATALHWYQLGAAQGNDVAEYHLAVLYEDGTGVEQNYPTALEWLQKAAAQHYSPAEYEIGMLYYHGNGVTKDLKTAFDWFKQSADDGSASGMTEVGYFYDIGQGVPQDYAQAMHWYQLAAAKGASIAESNIGILYENGRGVPVDYAKAMHWYQLAAAQHDGKAEYIIAEMYEDGNGVSKDEATAFTWYQRSANDDYTDAKVQVGYMYDYGVGVAHDGAQALAWYKRGVADGSGLAMYNIGTMYESGRGVPRDYSTAIEWYQQAEKAGYKDAQAAIDRVTAKMKPPPRSSQT